MKSIAYTLAVLLAAANFAQATDASTSNAPSAPTAQASSDVSASAKNPSENIEVLEEIVEQPSKTN